MLKFFSKLLKLLERLEYYYPSSFWVYTIFIWLCCTALLNQLPSSSKNSSSQAQIVVEQIRGGGKQGHGVHAFSPHPPKRQSPPSSTSGHFGSGRRPSNNGSGPGKGKPDGSNPDGDGDDLPQYPSIESIEETE